MPDPAKSLLERLTEFLTPQPTSAAERRQELIHTLREAQTEGLIDVDALSMIEGVFQVGQLCARDILVPRAQIDWIDINLPLSEIIKNVIAAAHSRFPVFDGSRDNVIGTLLAKDLLRHSSEEDFQVRDWLRPAVFIPESKRLSVLLRDFKDNRNHLAIVVDEYSGVAGIITIEDVLEQIVGDIEDEHDIDEEADNLIALDNGDIRVKGITELEQFNEMLGTNFQDDGIETVAGLVIQHLGRVPKMGELIEMDGIAFEVQRADPRQIHILLARQIPKKVNPD
ncbi:HlyC/CorC family transporter [Polynucleobacter sphagniphilus]|jgi:magnesium and cobalt transporter|uniref:HlyC/CorC family transporter n=1 Tax=Polynucleobacter sphagniphilus TaxID=1743169 RepID=UPI00096B7BDA|nr:transporter associated domain-containing protein [Polynucleobacter sphagniphilus]MDF9788635.1 magnesium and cobalt transporter [Polynucleobacter sphagniphilus]MDH6241802.1 magnesium and cobalt transporter [Polynucleobacter sphagniphilus]MDH6525293.1 magnesium and cobalt transporter [Polynucleobacter sphagniphilus]OLY96534.1 magnesium/cobalt efflux protein [Polynucleobacter sphagniphilus]